MPIKTLQGPLARDTSLPLDQAVSSAFAEITTKKGIDELRSIRIPATMI